jgi:myo-inositol catabolism protein IolS
MRYVRFGRTEVEVPAVSLGTWGQGGPRVGESGASVGWSGNDDHLAVDALIHAYERGITHWDTADVYGDGHSEELIGRVWDRVPREKIFLATKVGWDKGGYKEWYHPKMMRKHLERSLDLMKVETIDLHYLHHCDFGPNDDYFADAIATMRRFREEGKIRFIGLSDWSSPKIMRFVDRVNPDVIQPYRNLVDDEYESSGLRAWVDVHDAGVAFFSPLKHGLLLGKYEEAETFPEGDFRRNVAQFGDADAIARFRNAAAELRRRYADREEPVLHGVLGALLADAPTGCVLVGQRTPKHVDAAAAVGDALSIDEAEEVRRLYS